MITQKHHSNLFVKYLTNSFIFIGIISIIIGVLSYNYFENKIYNRIEQNLEEKAKIIDSQITVEEHNALLNDKVNEKTSIYMAVFDKVSPIISNFKDIAYVYTVYLKNYRVHFGIDFAPLKDMDGDGIIDHAYIHSEYDDAPLFLKKMFNNNNPFFNKTPYTDKWGDFVGFFYPIKNSLRPIILVIELKKSYIDSQKKYLKIIFFAFSVIYFSGLFISYYLLKKQYYKNYDFLTKNLKLERELGFYQKMHKQELHTIAIGKEFSQIYHNLNNPLCVIKNAVFMAKKNHEKIENYLAKIESNAIKIENILQNVKNVFDKPIVYETNEIPITQVMFHIKQEYNLHSRFFNVKVFDFKLADKIPMSLDNSMFIFKLLYEKNNQESIKISVSNDDYYDYINIYSKTITETTFNSFEERRIKEICFMHNGEFILNEGRIILKLVKTAEEIYNDEVSA